MKGFQVQESPAEAAFKTVELLLAGKFDEAKKIASCEAFRAQRAAASIFGNSTSGIEMDDKPTDPFAKLSEEEFELVQDLTKDEVDKIHDEMVELLRVAHEMPTFVGVPPSDTRYR